MALLIGAGAGGVTLADSIQAILRAVQGRQRTVPGDG